MPQRPIPEYWRQRVKALLAEHYGDVSVRQILLRLKDEERELAQSNDPNLRALAKALPSERTISRIKTTEWPQMSEKEQAEYRTFLLAGEHGSRGPALGGERVGTGAFELH